jgi:hypothetical protein
MEGKFANILLDFYFGLLRLLATKEKLLVDSFGSMHENTLASYADKVFETKIRKGITKVV